MFKKSSKFIALFIALALLTVSFMGLTGCSSREEGIWIGVFAPFSGGNATYGNDMYNSFRLAVDEINDAGGVNVGGEMMKLHLYRQDHGTGDTTMATTAASRIVSYGVDFIAGGYASGMVTPILQQVYDEGLLFLVANANSPRITEAGFSQTFMVNSTSIHAVVKLAELLNHLGDVQNVALIHQGDDWSRALSDIAAAELPKSGFNIVSTQVLPEGEIAVASTIATAIIASGADFVYWCGYHTDGGPMIRQLRQEGFTGHIAVGDGSASSELITAAGDFGDGVFVTSPPFARFSGPRGESFDSKYRERFGIPPEIYATISYDTIYLLKAAIEKAGSLEMEKVRDTLNEIEFEGVSNTIRFTAAREPDNSNFIIIQIDGADFKLVPLN